MSRINIFVFIIILLSIINYNAYSSVSYDNNASRYFNNITICNISNEKIVLHEIKKDTEITIGLNVRWSYRPGFLKTKLGNIATVSIFETKNESFPVHKFEFVDGSTIIGSSSIELVGYSNQGKYSINLREVRSAVLQPIQEQKINHVSDPNYSITWGTEFEGFREQTVDLNDIEFGYIYSRIVSRTETGTLIQGPYIKRGLTSIPFEEADGAQLSIPLKDIISLELASKDDKQVQYQHILTYRLPGSEDPRKIVGESHLRPDKDEHLYDAVGNIYGKDWRGTWELKLDMIIALRRVNAKSSIKNIQ